MLPIIESSLISSSPLKIKKISNAGNEIYAEETARFNYERSQIGQVDRDKIFNGLYEFGIAQSLGNFARWLKSIEENRPEISILEKIKFFCQEDKEYQKAFLLVEMRINSKDAIYFNNRISKGDKRTERVIRMEQVYNDLKSIHDFSYFENSQNISNALWIRVKDNLRILNCKSPKLTRLLNTKKAYRVKYKNKKHIVEW
jgi:hypothetical protein